MAFFSNSNKFNRSLPKIWTDYQVKVELLSKAKITRTVMTIDEMSICVSIEMPLNGQNWFRNEICRISVHCVHHGVLWFADNFYPTIRWPFLCVLCPIQIKHNLWWIFPWTLLLPFFSLSVYVSFFSISFVFIIYLNSCSSLFVSWRLPYDGIILFGIHFGVSKCVSLYFSLSQPTLSYTMAIGLFLSHIS